MFFELNQFTFLQSCSFFFPFSRLVCALEGTCQVKENTHDSTDTLDNFEDYDELQSINFSCSILAVNGRGFIEVLLSSIPLGSFCIS